MPKKDQGNADAVFTVHFTVKRLTSCSWQIVQQYRFLQTNYIFSKSNGPVVITNKSKLMRELMIKLCHPMQNHKS